MPAPGVNRFLENRDAQAKPFRWVADPDKIIAAVGSAAYWTVGGQQTS
jgi:hypothetical protein